LRDDDEPGTNLLAVESGEIESIDNNGAAVEFEDAEECGQKRGLAAGNQVISVGCGKERELPTCPSVRKCPPCALPESRG